MRCLVTGASGYVGGRLVPALLDAGHEVRAMARTASRLADRPWVSEVEVVEADAGDRAAVESAARGVDVAYYLLHSIGAGPDFEERDRDLARTFAGAARAEGVRRLVYLGGLGPSGPGVSPHLRSRAEVGEILLASGVPTAVLRAAVVLGSGSASFEMLRHLTERLPVMVTPRWVRSRIQPIAVSDVLRYLVGCASLPADVSRSFDIGGPDVLTYAQMMHRYARVAGLRRRVILPVPVLSPRLSSLWVGLVTPVPGALARPLVESLRNEVVCTEHDIARWVPDPPGGLTGFEDAVRHALARPPRQPAGAAAASTDPGGLQPWDPAWAGGTVYVDRRARRARASPQALWRVVEGIGGSRGWYSAPWAWRLRGLADRLFGGVGVRRGRRDPDHLRVGDTVDFWRVETVEPGRLLRLRAEMRLPGQAWLELGVHDASVYTQRAVFVPRGLAGHLYWWAVAPFHAAVFAGMARNIARAAEDAETRESGQ